MKNHFIKNINIKKFKCFISFQAEGFARINLIGGKNNVGKTAFMEACYVNSSAQDLKKFLSGLFSIKFRRENLNLILCDWGEVDRKTFIENSSGLSINTNINATSFKINENKGIKKYFFQFSNQSIEVPLKDFSFEITTIPDSNLFIDSFGLSNKEIINAYTFIQKRDKEIYLNKLLKKFDSNIDAFKVIEQIPQCKIGSKYLPLTELGDGVRHLVSIVVCLYASKNGYLYIDEVENGIHHTMLDEIWELIFRLSQELNVQIFTTTHSKECIESYARIIKKLNEKEATYTILTKLESGSIDAGVYTPEMIINTLEQDHEVRGW